MADAHQTFGEHMQQEATDELLRRQRHFALLAAVRVVFPAKGDFAVLHADETVVGNGDAVCVAGQIVQHVFRSAERLPHIDHPLVAVERMQEARK